MECNFSMAFSSIASKHATVIRVPKRFSSFFSFSVVKHAFAFVFLSFYSSQALLPPPPRHPFTSDWHEATAIELRELQFGFVHCTNGWRKLLWLAFFSIIHFCCAFFLRFSSVSCLQRKFSDFLHKALVFTLVCTMNGIIKKKKKLKKFGLVDATLHYVRFWKLCEKCVHGKLWNFQFVVAKSRFWAKFRNSPTPNRQHILAIAPSIYFIYLLGAWKS